MTKKRKYKKKKIQEKTNIEPAISKASKQSNKSYWVIGIIIAVIILGYLHQDLLIPEPTEEKVIQCIAENSEFYATTVCGYCKQQKSILGENNLHLFNITYCDQNPDPCVERGIGSVPFWIIEGQGYLGIQTIDQLKTLTGC